MYNILYSFDDPYAEVVAVSMISLLKNNSDLEEITIHVLGIKVSEKNITLLKGMVEEYGAKLVYYEISNELDKYASLNRKKDMIGMYGRLFAPQYLPENVKRILYIDGDTLCLGSIKEAFEMDMTDKYLAAVYDIYLPPMKVKEKIKFDKNDLYINSGVLFMNLEQWRKHNLEDKCYFFLRDNPQAVLNDQDAINSVCKNKTALLPLQFNLTFLSTVLPYKDSKIVMDKASGLFYTQQDYEYAQRNPVIVHFASELFGKPWTMDSCMPYKNEYLEYKNLTPWRDVPLKPRKYANSKLFSVYKKKAEALIRKQYQKGNYRKTVKLYKLLYQNMHKIQTLF